MFDVFVIAEEEIVLAFQAAGVAGRSVAGKEEALEAFRYATDAASGPAESRTSDRPAAGRSGSRAKVLILTEEVADLLDEETREWQLSGEYPLIVEIPSQRPRPADRKNLLDAVREAVGVSI